MAQKWYDLHKDNLKEQQKNVVLGNLLSGKTKEGIMGDDFFKINNMKISNFKN